jgi:hypothetical protein
VWDVSTPQGFSARAGAFWLIFGAGSAILV